MAWQSCLRVLFAFATSQWSYDASLSHSRVSAAGRLISEPDGYALKATCLPMVVAWRQLVQGSGPPACGDLLTENSTLPGQAAHARSAPAHLAGDFPSGHVALGGQFGLVTLQMPLHPDALAHPVAISHGVASTVPAAVHGPVEQLGRLGVTMRVQGHVQRPARPRWRDTRGA